MAVFFDYLIKLFIAIAIFYDIKTVKSVNVELVLSLKEHFKSDVVLIAIDNQKNYRTVKKFHELKYNQTQGLIGVINVNEDFEILAEKKYITTYQNTIVVWDKEINVIEKLAKFKDLTLMAAIVWVGFVDDEYIQKLEDLYIPINCQFLIIKEINALNYEIQDVYQTGPNSSKIYSNFAEWKNGELEVYQKYFYSKRMDLRKYQLNISTSEFARQFNYLWMLFSEKMNISINWLYPLTGYLHPNGTKTGLFQLLYERKIDGTPPTMVYTEERLKVYDYIFPVIINEVKIYAKSNPKLNWTSYIAPFNKDVWISIFLWIILISGVNYFIIRFNKWQVTANYEGSFFSVAKALFSQGGILKTSSSSLCILYLMPYFVAIVLTQYYSGALSSYLSLRQSSLPFKNFEEVIEDKSYKISLVNRTYLLFFFRVDNGTTAKAIRKHNLLVEQDQSPSDHITGFSQLCDNRWIFLGPSFGVDIKENCEIVELKDVVYKESLGIMVWKGFPLKDILNKLLRKLQSVGIEKLKRKNKIVSSENLNIFKPFSMELVFPIFLIYLLACVLSVLIFLGEIRIKKF